MAYTTIDKPTDYFNTKLYTGNGSTQSITGVGFQPDWVWFKQRSGATWHNLYDVLRGTTKALASNDTGGDDTRVQGLTAFNSDGFTIGTDNNVNGSTNTYVAWNWKAGGTAVSNTQGSITSSVSANTTSGFSIVSYTGNGTNGATIGHGLGSTPSMIIFKPYSVVEDWTCYHQSLGATQKIDLNNTDAAATNSTVFNDTAPTSSVFSVGTNGRTNGSSYSIIAYCFAEKKGFSKFGSYTGNGSTDGTFVYTGFRPAYLMVKRTNAAVNWYVFDSKRNTYNAVNLQLSPNLSNAEASDFALDFLSNGFKFRIADSFVNGTGDPYIYMAFAENPLVGTNNIPATAR